MSRLVNPRGISIFYPSLKVRVKVISVNMKIGTMNVVFVAISHVRIVLKYMTSKNYV